MEKRVRYDAGRRPPGTRAEGPWTPDRVGALRAGMGLTQAQFAGELGVRQQTVSEWETGRYQPRGASARMLQLLEEAAAYDDGSDEREDEG